MISVEGLGFRNCGQSWRGKDGPSIYTYIYIYICYISAAEVRLEAGSGTKQAV